LTTNDYDSDSESGNSQCGDSIFSSSSSSDDEDSNNIPLGDTWDQGCDFNTNNYGLLHAKRCVGMTGTWFIACQMTAITLSLMSAVAEV
jgi:hypothetical protein